MLLHPVGVPKNLANRKVYLFWWDVLNFFFGGIKV